MKTTRLVILVCSFVVATAWAFRASSAIHADPAARPRSEATSQAVATPSGAAEEWLVDSAGRQYKEEKLDKSVPHQRIDKDHLRTVWGVISDLAREDEHAYYVKVYRVEGATGPMVPKGPTEEEKKAAAATYVFDLKTSKTLEFQPFDTGLPRTGEWRHGFVLADMNGDGKLDIVHGPPRHRPLPPHIYLGDGHGKWHRWEEVTFPAQGYDYGDVAVADFNGDKHMDIVMGMHLLGMTVLLGDGAGNFKAANKGLDEHVADQAFTSRAVGAVDWDGDGKVDILALGEGPRLEMSRDGTAGAPRGQPSMGVVLYRNAGDGTWEKKTGVQASGLFGDVMALGRFAPKKRWALVAGSGAQGRDDLLFLPGDPFVQTKLSGVRPMSFVRALAVADFDGDGNDDLAIGYSSFEAGEWRTGIDVLLMRPGKTAERRTVYVQDGAQGVSALGAGDLDGDRRPDLVALTADGEVMVLRNQGGTFTREDVSLTERVPGCRGYHVEIADLDGDGLGDITASFAGESEGIAMMGGTPGCPGGGSLRAWRTQHRTPQSPLPAPKK